MKLPGYVKLLLLAGLPRAARGQSPRAAGSGSAGAAPDSVSRPTSRFLWFQVDRPTKAALFSALLPGAGQIYNRKYWKLPLVYGSLGLAVGVEIHYQRRLREYIRAYDARTDNDPSTMDTGPRSSREQTKENVKAGGRSTATRVTYGSATPVWPTGCRSWMPWWMLICRTSTLVTT